MKRILRRDTLSIAAVLLLLGCIDGSRPLQPTAADAAYAAGPALTTYSIHDLGTLPGTTLGCCSEGHDINVTGDIAGFSTASDGRFHAVLWQGSTILDLGIPAGGYSDTFAEGLNDAGTVVGIANTGTVQPGAGFIWSATTGMTLLTGPGPVPKTTTAWDINNAGVVVGQVAGPGVRFHAYKYTVAGGYVDLHPPGYQSSNALAIAENGDVAGVVTLPGFAALHAALWLANGTFIDLGTLGSTTATAFGLNSLGSVVGSSEKATGVEFGFRWTSTTGMQPSPQPGRANDISDGGRIVGSAVNGSVRIPGTKLGSGAIEALPQFPGRRGGEVLAVNRCGFATGSAKLMVNGVLSTHGARWTQPSCDP
ncbi:MAG: hypothetical protein ABI877_19810 [Gemmatimonadaceae bacterium]